MSRLKCQTVWVMVMLATWSSSVLAHSYKINTTIHDTNLAHVTYSDASIECNNWVYHWLSRPVCSSWLKPWTSGVYHSQDKTATFHSSLNNQLASVTIEFQGTDIWVYGPPASQLAKLPPDYKICLHESYLRSPKHQCYQINITAAYSASDNDEPAVIFAQGQLPANQHRIVISVADPLDDLRAYNGVKFSHAVYTVERSTPWPVEEDRWRYKEVVMHDTHPLLSYYPATFSKWIFWRTHPWSAKVHITENGIATSWHEIKSYDEDDRDQWGVETKIKAGSASIYGAPRAYIQSQDSLGFVCVQLDLGPCETIDVKTMYANQKNISLDEPVLLWCNDTLDSSRETRVFIRLVKTANGTPSTFPFKSINYLEQKEYSSPAPLVGTLQNVTVNHDDRAIVYNPGRRCESRGFFSQCNSWFDPWKWREAGPLGSVLTYRSTAAKYRVKEDPHITVSFSGSAVYLYGAPEAYASRPFAPQHVCINGACRVIDVEQAYLHPPREDMESTGISEIKGQNVTIQDGTKSMSVPHPELEPVLIWGTTGLDDKIGHTLRLALASLPTPEDAEMTIVKVVYTQVTYGWRENRPDPPAPAPEYAYSGPLHPPHATEWVPLGHKPPPPISIIPPPHEQASSIPVLAFALLVACCLLPSILNAWRRKTNETEPLLPGPSLSRPQPSRSQLHSEPSSLHRSNHYHTHCTDPIGARAEPSSALEVHTPASPPGGLNAVDTPPDYSSVVSGGSNWRR